jgi:hypothetical protein
MSPRATLLARLRALRASLDDGHALHEMAEEIEIALELLESYREYARRLEAERDELEEELRETCDEMCRALLEERVTDPKARGGR